MKFAGGGRERHGALLALWLALILSVGASSCKKKQAASAPPPEVQVVTVTPKDVPITSEWIGTLDGYVNAQIRAQVTGYLLTQNYVEGSQVKKGDLLFQIDPRPFEATLDQAKGNLAQAQAQLGRTQLDVKRLAPLAKVNAISQQELDNAVQANLAAEAQVKSAQAAVENAQLNLNFTKVTSPIDGVAGLAQAQIGDLVGPNSGPLTAVSVVDPIKVYFNVSEQQYLNYRRQHTDPTERQAHEQELELELILADGSIYPQKGKFLFVDRQVDVNTGTLRITGAFPNPNFVLRPGQFARVRAKTQERKGALIVPQRAVTELQGSYQIDIVDEQNKVHVVPVKVGAQIDSNWIIEEGLKPGQRVIVEGIQKVKEGMVVNPKPFEQPHPAPEKKT